MAVSIVMSMAVRQYRLWVCYPSDSLALLTVPYRSILLLNNIRIDTDF